MATPPSNFHGAFFLGQHLRQKHHLNILFEPKCIHHAHSNPASSSAVFNFLSCAGGGGGGHHAFGSGPTQVGGAGGLFAKGFALLSRALNHCQVIIILNISVWWWVWWRMRLFRNALLCWAAMLRKALHHFKARCVPKVQCWDRGLASCF